MDQTEFRLLTGYLDSDGFDWDCWSTYETLELAMEGMIKLLNSPGLGSHPQLLPIKILEAMVDDPEEAGVLVHQQGLSLAEWGDRIDRGEISLES